MSVAFYLNSLIYDCMKDPERMKAFLGDRKGVASEYGLNEEEIQALVENDVGKLFRLGANPLILMGFAMGLGIAIPDYLQSIREQTA